MAFAAQIIHPTQVRGFFFFFFCLGNKIGSEPVDILDASRSYLSVLIYPLRWLQTSYGSSHPTRPTTNESAYSPRVQRIGLMGTKLLCGLGDSVNVVARTKVTGFLCTLHHYFRAYADQNQGN